MKIHIFQIQVKAGSVRCFYQRYAYIFLLIGFIVVGLSFLDWQSVTGDTPIIETKKDALTTYNYLPIVSKQIYWVKSESNLPQDWIRDITINPSIPHEMLIALRDNGIFKSEDQGLSWKAVYSFGQADAPSARQISFATSNPDIVYATVINNVLRSSDGGETWSKIWPAELPGGGWGLAVDPEDPNHVYIGINADAENHVYETINGGQSWIPRNLVLGDQEGIISLAINPANTNQVLAGANTDVAEHPLSTRLYISDDRGVTWELVESGFPNSKRITSINFTPCVPNQILISRQPHGQVDNYHRRSDNGGLSWNIVPFFDDDIGISVNTPCLIYTAMHRSIDSGFSWQDISYNFYALIPNPEDVRFTSWAPDPWNDVLWVGTREHGLYSIKGVVTP
ncbi:MAG: hypothetical protein A2Y53_02095 [Chloroflexi bacterium RBG_16_47_49]|nr:MAG: hypothetical protein A2Y53_02095 [Chloroflexi bacterium RBG_16_47_49]